MLIINYNGHDNRTRAMKRLYEIQDYISLSIGILRNKCFLQSNRQILIKLLICDWEIINYDNFFYKNTYIPFAFKHSDLSKSDSFLLFFISKYDLI